MLDGNFLAIDFGTSNSSVSYIDGSKITSVMLDDTIADQQDRHLLPSAVYVPAPLSRDTPAQWLGHTQVLTGIKAIKKFNKDKSSGKYFAAFKPLLQELAHSKGSFRYQESFLGYREMDYEYLGSVKEGRMRYYWDSNFYHRGYYYTPDELKGAVAVIINTLWREAQRVAKEKAFTGIVLGVPVGFSRVAKQRLQEAIELTKQARRENIFFVSEPVAIALRYADEGYQDERYALVFDYGGGTLDLSLIEFFPIGEAVHFKVLNKKGYPVAGRNIDMALAGYLQRERIPSLYSKLGSGNKIKSPGDISDQRFWTGVEGAKINLSSQEVTELLLPQFKISELISRKEFEANILATLLAEIRSKLKELLGELSLPESRVDRVLMAGGSSKIPAVKQLLEEIFPGKVDNRYAGSGTSVEGLALALKKWDQFEDVTGQNLYLWDFFTSQAQLLLPARISFKDASAEEQLKKDYGLVLHMKEPTTKAILLLCEEFDAEYIANSFWEVHSSRHFTSLRLIADWDPNKGDYRVEAFDKETLRPLEIKKSEIDEDTSKRLLKIGDLVRIEQGNESVYGQLLGIRNINTSGEHSFAAGDCRQFILTVINPEKLTAASIRAGNEQIAIFNHGQGEYDSRELYQGDPQKLEPFNSSFQYHLEKPIKEEVHQ